MNSPLHSSPPGSPRSTTSSDVPSTASPETEGEASNWAARRGKGDESSWVELGIGEEKSKWREPALGRSGKIGKLGIFDISIFIKFRNHFWDSGDFIWFSRTIVKIPLGLGLTGNGLTKKNIRKFMGVGPGRNRGVGLLVLDWSCDRFSGWWFQPLWKTMDFVSWDDDIPNWMEK